MGELQAALESMFDAFERGDVEALVALVGSDAQGVDEISRKWLRGTDEVQNYLQRACLDGHGNQDGRQRRQRDDRR